MDAFFSVAANANPVLSVTALESVTFVHPYAYKLALNAVALLIAFDKLLI